MEKKKLALQDKYFPYTSINFNEINLRAKQLAQIIESRFKKLNALLLKYESNEVVQDEVGRTLDLLNSLNENKNYFSLRIGAVTTFLPRNQPLYSFACFAIVPSLMGSEVHLRIPHGMKFFFPEMLNLLDIHRLFPNIFISNKQRIDFLKERSALMVDRVTKQSHPITDVAIFTGTTNHADQLRLIFDRRTLFIANGAGHNPIIVSKDAALNKAIEASISLVLYNQGQDCSAPNSILVHQLRFKRFLSKLDAKLKQIKIGPYSDRSCIVGPISEHEDLKRIQSILVDNAKWLDKKRPGVISTYSAIVEPTIIKKPLKEGGNYVELFAPIFFIQQYDKDKDLALYFENKNYIRNAMNISLYGSSHYIKSIVGKLIGGRVLHPTNTILHDTHPHAPGIERGTQPYGGYGYGTSSISINGEIIPMPTLPQRDIYKWVVEPLLINKKGLPYLKFNKRHAKVEVKDVEKILRLKLRESNEENINLRYGHRGYLDSLAIKKIKRVRYIKIEERYHYRLLNEPNIEYIPKLELEDIKFIRNLRKLVLRKSALTADEFRTLLYNIPRVKNMSDNQNRKNQYHFFKNVYQLLLGTESGPQLAEFLMDIETNKVEKLLDI